LFAQISNRQGCCKTVSQTRSFRSRGIAIRLREATFTVEELRSERRVYDPFLIASYGSEGYYVEVRDELDFERKYT